MTPEQSINTPILIFDLDGTLANIEHRRHLVTKPNHDWPAFYRACVDDTPNPAVVEVWRAFYVCGRPYEHWIVSGRSDEVRLETELWLAKHYLAYHNLLMRPADDYRPDEVLKREWIEPIKHRVLMVFDDRDKVVRMWRSMGIPCLQVAEGDF